ncbi:MAG: hypothetical protein KKF68_03045 [Nanoarchaeota archaeon]|nr:hypothetical protein [Nanoarchaeota archaeon]
MKKIGVLFFVSLFLCSLFLNIISAQDDLQNVGENLEDRLDALKETEEKYGDEDYWKEKWDYLGSEWKTILLKNPFVSGVDSFFTKINIVFRVLFGMDYSLSLTLFAVFLLWLCVVFDVGSIINSWGIVKGVLAYLISTLLAIILAQVQVFKNIVILLGRVAFSPEHEWTRFLVIIVLFVFILLFHSILQAYSKYLEARRKKIEEHATDLARKGFMKFVEKFRKTSSAK